MARADQDGRHLWVGVRGLPLGATPLKDGGFLSPPPTDELYYLDFHAMRLRNGPPKVGPSYVDLTSWAGIVSNSTGKMRVLMYRPGEITNSVDCVLQPQAQAWAYIDDVLGSTAPSPKCVSMSADGRLVALIERDGDEPSVVIIDIPTRTRVAVWQPKG